MNKAEMMMLRLTIILMRKLGYTLPLLKDARPIRTGRWNIYRHYGRLIRLRPMAKEKQARVEMKQRELDDEYKDQYNQARLTYARKIFREMGAMPGEDELEKYMLLWSEDNPWPEYRPCEECQLMRGRIIPCPYYNVVADSTHHACCTHDYEIIKDAPEI